VNIVCCHYEGHDIVNNVILRCKYDCWQLISTTFAKCRSSYTQLRCFLHMLRPTTSATNCRPHCLSEWARHCCGFSTT